MLARNNSDGKCGVTGRCKCAIKCGRRTWMDGVELAWQLTSPLAVIDYGVVPFFIDWGALAHPALSAAQGLTLVDLRAEHPLSDQVQRMLTLLGVTLNVRYGTTPALIATIDGPHGRIVPR